MTGASTRQRSAQTAAGLADDLAELGPVALGRFFGGTGLRLEEVQFGFVMGISLYLRVDETSRPILELLGGRPFQYRANGRTVMVSSYCEVPEVVRQDQAALLGWAREALRAARAARVGRQ